MNQIWVLTLLGLAACASEIENRREVNIEVREHRVLRLSRKDLGRLISASTDPRNAGHKTEVLLDYKEGTRASCGENECVFAFPSADRPIFIDGKESGRAKDVSIKATFSANELKGVVRVSDKARAENQTAIEGKTESGSLSCSANLCSVDFLMNIRMPLTITSGVDYGDQLAASFIGGMVGAALSGMSH